VIKWFAAFVGFLLFRLPGALIGYFLGSFFDSGNKGTNGRQTLFRQESVSPAEFELNLLSLCSIIIKADGQATSRELDYVRQYFVATYGKDKANAIFRTFNEVIKKREISTERISLYMTRRTRYEVRLQLLHFLFGVAQADGLVSQAEAYKLEEISRYFKIGRHDFESIRAMFIKSGDNAYKILEIDKAASNDEVKKAYRKMAKKYHPDKVITADEAIRKGAEEKFKEVQKAYETIQQERGMN